MKLILAGDPDYEFTVLDYAGLEQLHASQCISELRVAGHNAFAECAQIWAKLVRLPLLHFSADWVAYRPERTVTQVHPILDKADAAALFSPGLCPECHEFCQEHGLRVYDFRAP